MKEGLVRFKRLDIPIQTVVDVGAAEGGWSLSAREFWPAASYLLFEPLSERKDQLESLCKRHPQFTFLPFAAGAEKGEVHFSVADDLDGSGVASEVTRGTVRRVQVESVQRIVKARSLKGPFIVKLDTHGFELPIIKGCSEILDEISLFVIECYGFRIAPRSLLFWEMCRHMDELGFRLFDIVDIMHRPIDGAFWQCDAFFIRKDHPLFSDNKYS